MFDELRWSNPGYYVGAGALTRPAGRSPARVWLGQPKTKDELRSSARTSASGPTWRGSSLLLLAAARVLVAQTPLKCLRNSAISALPAPSSAQAKAIHFPAPGFLCSDVKNRQNQIFMITGDDGHFEFRNLPAGKYALNGAKRGYISAAYDQHEQFSTAIVTGAGVDTENLTLRLVRTAVLTGHVFDESGEPVRGATVTLWRDDHSAGVSRTVSYRSDQSDDLGSFEFAPLDAGTYFVSAAAKPWYAVHPPSGPSNRRDRCSHLRSIARWTWFTCPRTTRELPKLKMHSPILIRGGDRLDFDLRLTPVPALHVTLRTPAPQAGQGFQMPMLFKRDFDGSQQALQPEVQMTAPGVVEITAAPGKYELRLPQHERSAQPEQRGRDQPGQSGTRRLRRTGRQHHHREGRSDWRGCASAANGIRASQRSATRRRLGADEPSPRSHIRRPCSGKLRGPRRGRVARIFSCLHGGEWLPGLRPLASPCRRARPWLSR